MRRAHRIGCALALTLAQAVTTTNVLADTTSPVADATDNPIVVWPTLTPAGDAPSELSVHVPSVAEASLYARAQELDATLRDAVQDLGYSLDIADAGPKTDHARDLDMIERAS